MVIQLSLAGRGPRAPVAGDDVQVDAVVAGEAHADRIRRDGVGARRRRRGGGGGGGAAAAACVMVTVEPATISVPVRGEVSGLAATSIRTRPDPVPPEAPWIVIHGAADAAVHGQSAADAVTAISPASPPAGMAPTWATPRRCTSASVAVVSAAVGSAVAAAVAGVAVGPGELPAAWVTVTTAPAMPRLPTRLSEVVFGAMANRRLPESGFADAAFHHDPGHARDGGPRARCGGGADTHLDGAALRTDRRCQRRHGQLAARLGAGRWWDGAADDGSRLLDEVRLSGNGDDAGSRLRDGVCRHRERHGP